MKILFFNLLMFFLSAMAQCQVTLTGKITAADGKAIQFANVLLMQVDDTSLVKGSITNESGEYQLNGISIGKYFIRYSAVGFLISNTAPFELTTLLKKKDLGIQVMEEDNKALKEVIIKAEKPLYQQTVAGTVVNVEASLLTKGSSALQVLERSPGVVINHRDNSIELNGKSGVTIMLNGKLMRMSMEQLVSLLNGMSADDIATIELMTTPPAKYDAEGSAGLINIVLKKNKKQGTSGAVSLTAGYGYREKGMGSINLSHNKKNINLYGSYTFSHNSTYSKMFVTSAQHMAFLGGDVSVDGRFVTNAVRNNHDATLGLDLKLTPNTTIGGSIVFNSNKAASTDITNAGYNILPDSLLQFTGNNRGLNRWNNLVNSVYLEKLIKQGEKINFTMDYLYFNNNGDYEVQSSFINKHGVQAGSDEILFSPRQKGLARTTIQVGVAQIDYTRPVNNTIKLETGIKGAYTQSASVSWIQSRQNDVWTGNDQTANNIVMKEGIGAAYIAATAQMTSSTSLAAGVRYEYSYTNMDDPASGKNIASRKSGSLFPSIFFTKKLHNKSELQMSYTKRISRPSYNDLASYIAYSDPTAVYTGNPFLKPTITHNIKLGYNYKSYAFSLLFSRDINAIARYQLSESPAADMLYISPQNLTWQNNINLQVNLPWKVNEWWVMNYSFTGGLRQYKVSYTKQSFENSYIGYSINFSQTFKLPENLSAELSGWYNSTSYNGTVKVSGYGILNAGIKKELKNNKGSFQLSVSDLLRNERINVRYGTLTEEAFSIKSHVIVNTETARFPILKLTYARSFGGIKSERKQRNGAKDENERIRKD